MPRANYQPKPGAKAILDEALAAATINGGANAVVAFGKYGERGIALFPAADTRDPEPGSCVGFCLIGKNVNTGHLNMSRDDARDIVRLLIEQFCFQVTTETVTTAIAQVG